MSNYLGQLQEFFSTIKLCVMQYREFKFLFPVSGKVNRDMNKYLQQTNLRGKTAKKKKKKKIFVAVFLRGEKKS